MTGRRVYPRGADIPQEGAVRADFLLRGPRTLAPGGRHDPLWDRPEGRRSDTAVADGCAVETHSEGGTAPGVSCHPSEHEYRARLE